MPHVSSTGAAMLQGGKNQMARINWDMAAKRAQVKLRGAVEIRF
jgi:hypothetical protein